MHRARPNRHERTGESHGGSIPTISFDFFYTRLMVRRSPQKKFLMVLSLIIVCSATGFIFMRAFAIKESFGSYEP